MPTREEKFMARAIDIAKRGEGQVSPNPLVGSVIVHKDRIISEGWHQKFGEAHAEVNAIRNVDDSILKESKIFVSLEPCSHFGKTPPCANLIIEKGIPKVYVAMRDPNPKVAGAGIKRIKDAGIKLEVGILESEARDLNRRFITSIEKKRPYVVLKWARSSDGYISGPEGKQVAISNEISLQYSHKLRAFEDAIMVGTNTVLNDNPSLTCRYWQGHNPIRISMDFNSRLNSNLKIFDQNAPTFVFHKGADQHKEGVHYIHLDRESDNISEMLEAMNNKNINSVIIEGGASLLNQFIQKGLWDEAHVFESNVKLHSGIHEPDFNMDSYQNHQILKSDNYYFFKNN